MFITRSLMSPARVAAEGGDAVALEVAPTFTWGLASDERAITQPSLLPRRGYQVRAKDAFAAGVEAVAVDQGKHGARHASGGGAGCG